MSFHLLPPCARPPMTFAPRLRGETGLICHGLYTRMSLRNRNTRSAGESPAPIGGGASPVHLVGLPSGYLAFKYVRRAIGDAGGRFSGDGNCHFILIWTAINRRLIECGSRRIEFQW